ncbi:MAG: sigma 54-interacting transcriptional regulator [Planctomycetes bacterium]|nr:sigma 54-interacting transcriptional regulator [Planctomycetota bacterium]
MNVYRLTGNNSHRESTLMYDLQSKRLATLCAVIGQVNRGTTIDEILDIVFREFRDHVPYDRIAVAILEDDRRALRWIAIRSNRPLKLKVGYTCALAGSPLEPVVNAGEVRVVPDFEKYRYSEIRWEPANLLLEEGVRSSLALPLFVNNTPIGIIFFSSRSPDVYTQAHADLLREIVGQVALVIERTRFIEALSRQNRELEAANELKASFVRKLEDEVRLQTAEVKKAWDREHMLLRVSNAINASLDIEAIFRITVTEIRNLVRFDRASITLLDETGQHVRFAALEPAQRDILGRNDVIPVEGSAIGQAARSQKTIIAQDLQFQRGHYEDDLLLRAGIRSYVFTPLILRGTSIGTFNLASSLPVGFSEDDIALLAQVAEQMTIAVANARAYEEIKRLKEELQAENVYLKDELSTEHQFFEIVGANPELGKALRDAERVALTDATVLIRGETGTGKELIARAVHRLSKRRERALIKVNCAALPETLIASELFGHEKGAFTGAVSRKLGRFELADGSTLFLDEIGDLPLEIQAKILRVLQDKEFERVGGTETHRVDVRVVAATNRDLEEAIAAGNFRPDLYYRLNVFPITLPPLRERAEDIRALALHFVAKYARRMSKKISKIAHRSMQVLLNYSWPGNVRELENLIERACIVCDGDTLHIDEGWLQSASLPAPTPEFRTLEEMRDHLRDTERRFYYHILHASSGRIYGDRGAAALLSIRPTTLQSRLKKLGITKFSVNT